jgi:hypothetical protein
MESTVVNAYSEIQWVFLMPELGHKIDFHWSRDLYGSYDGSSRPSSVVVQD